jgi:hypothetical protein
MTGRFSLLLLLCMVESYACATTGRRTVSVAGPEPERKALRDALEMLPRDFDIPVSIIDPEAVPDPAAVRRLDAFTVVEPDGSPRRRIYVNRESPVLQEAMKGHDLYLKVLAAIVVHESAHLSGASEARAQTAESAFFASLVARGLVNPADGQRYLAALRAREF